MRRRSFVIGTYDLALDRERITAMEANDGGILRVYLDTGVILEMEGFDWELDSDDDVSYQGIIRWWEGP